MTSAVDYDLRLALRAVRRYWWIVLLVPAVALAFQLYSVRTAPHRAEFRAVVILPGDTEDPGRSERPELMIMDDVPTLVGSTAFAERVSAVLAGEGVSLDISTVRGALSATRFARTVTVVARDDEADQAAAIARGAETAFPEAVNAVMIADGAEPASITIIDPVGDARRGEPNQWRVAAIVTIVMGFVGVLAVLVVDGLRRPDASSASSDNDSPGVGERPVRSRGDGPRR